MTRHPDAIVVGAGIVGAATALALAQEGLGVLVLEAGFAGGGATGAAMGHVVVMDDSAAQLALTSYSRRLWTELAPALPPECSDHASGTIWIAAAAAELAEARRRSAGYARAGIHTELLDERQLRACEPALRHGLTGGLLVPDDRILYPPAAARWLLDQARAHGAACREGTEVMEIGARRVRLRDETLEAGLAINCAGPAAASLMPALPIVPRRGHLAITGRYEGFCRRQLIELGYMGSAHTLTAESIAFNVQPRPNGQLLIGSSRELVGWERELNRPLLGRMLARAMEYLPGLAQCQVLRAWVGFRPSTADQLPLIGRCPEAEGAWVAAGHEGLGVTTALGTARLLADLILGRSPAIDPAPYRVDRAMPDAA